MTALGQDVRYAIRTLRRSPGLTAVIVLTLALGIGANTAIFSVVNGVLLQPLPYEHGNRLVQLQQQVTRAEALPLGFSAQELHDYRAQARSLDGLVEYHTMWFNLLGQGAPERVQTGVVSWNYFEVLGVQPILGRGFQPSEDARGAEPVIVLGYDYWRRRFGGERDVIGRTVEMNDQSHTVIGVMPPIPQYPNDNDVWMPWFACPFRSSDNAMQNRQVRMLAVFGRLHGGESAERAQADLSRISQTMVQTYAEAYPATGIVSVSVTPLKEQIVADARTRFLLLLGMAGLVLLIACANVANLTLARIHRREQELVVRSALGATRTRLLRQLLTESVLLALVGGVIGVAIAAAVSDLLVSFAAQFTPRAQEVRIDGWVLAFAIAIAGGTGLVIGAVPGLLLGSDLAARLRDGGRHSTQSGGRTRARAVLVAAQVAIAFILLAGAGLMARSLYRLLSVDTGFDAHNVLTLRVDVDFATRTNAEQRRALFDPVIQRVSALPGVVAVGLTNNFPLNGGVPTAPLQIEGRPVAEDGDQPRVDVRLATPGYFDVLRIPVLRGRALASGDVADAPPVAVINQTMARHFWAAAEPIGQRISLDGQNWFTIVGVVADVKQQSLDATITDEFYVPLDVSPPLGVSLLVRTAGEPAALARQITEAVHSVDPRQPVAFVRTLEDVRRDSVATPRLTALLLGLFAMLALAIAFAGIVGVVAYAVGQRTHEIGIRMALGARQSQMIGMLLLQGLLPVVAGLAIGIAAALAAGRLMRGMLYQTLPSDPITFLTVSAALLGVALLAIWLPARRVTRIDPMLAFRADA